MAQVDSTTQELKTITADQLRQILFFVVDQEMTIEEFRRRLFNSPVSSSEVRISFDMFEKMQIDA